MLPLEEGPGEVVKPFSTVLAGVSSACLLPVVATALGDFVGRATRTPHPVGPVYPSDFFVTSSFIDEVVEAAHGGQAQSGQSPNFVTPSKPNMSQKCHGDNNLGLVLLYRQSNLPPGHPKHSLD